MKLTILAAKSINNVIGKDNALPWELPLDLKKFRAMTMGHPIIMGRKTHQSIGKPLPGRLNIVITRSQEYMDGVIKVDSLPAAVSAASREHDQAFIIGGQALYQMALPWAEEMIITEVLKEFEGDAYFPQFNSTFWDMTNSPAPFLDGDHWCSVSKYVRNKEDKLGTATIFSGKRTPEESFRLMMSMSMGAARQRVRQRLAKQEN